MWPPTIKLKMLIATILPLLLSINTKQTGAQAQANYGLGGYTMDDKKMVMVPEHALLLNTADDVKNYKTNTHTDKQFKPCRVELNGDSKFEVFYDEDTAKDGCTVDFVMDKIDETKKAITTHIKVADEKMACLEDCGIKNVKEDNELAASSANLVPFTYSQSNEQFEKLHDGPRYNEEQASCKDNLDCAVKGGKCMASATSLQLGWNKCAGDKVRARAWIQLVGEPISAWSAEIKDKSKENPDVTTFELSIEMGDNPEHKGNNVPLFTVTGQDGIPQRFLHKLSGGANIYPACFVHDELPMIPEPQFWTINSGNTQINGKHLFVFHLLPQSATRVFVKNGILQNDQQPESGMPKCKGKLSIIFENVAGLLQSSESPPASKTTPSKGSAETTKATGEETTEAAGNPDGIGTGAIIGIVVGAVVLLLIIFAALMWFFCCKDKDSDNGGDEDAETGEDKERILVDSCMTPAETRCE